MQFTAEIKENLIATIEAIQVTPDTNPLQAQLDAVTAERNSLRTELARVSESLTQTIASRDELGRKISAAQEALA